ncbi:class I SAM-dependent methyltransferase [Desulfocurvus sp. DL9XJH121]
MRQPDTLYTELLKSFRSGESVDWASKRVEFAEAVQTGIKNSKLYYEYAKLQREVGADKSISILDYGCGGGMFVLYLLLDGYQNVKGVDTSDRSEYDDFIKTILGIEGGEPILQAYDCERLPFDDQEFDAVVSIMVMEHVHDIDSYYRECARVLKPRGVVLLDFMHRLEPFDTHSRCWIVHYFPIFIRKILYDKFSDKGYSYYNEILNLKTVASHRKYSAPFFSNFKSCTKRRLKEFDYGRERYKGYAGARSLVARLINLPLVGGGFLELLSHLAGADIVLRK